MADGKIEKVSNTLTLLGQITKIVLVIAVVVGGYFGYRYASQKFSDMSDAISKKTAAIGETIADATAAFGPSKPLICPADMRASGDALHVLCYEKCPDGYVSDGANFCHKACPAGWGGTETMLYCEHKTIYSSVGADTSQSIPNACGGGRSYRHGLCYDLPAGWDVTSPGFIGKVCPSGMRDDGTACWQDIDTYGRGAGSFSEDACRSDARGACEKAGLLWYPVCRPGYHTTTVNFCQRDPVRISKEVQAQVGTLPDACPAGRELHGRLCYPTCPSGYARTAGNIEMCSNICPAGFNDIGVGGCQKPSTSVTVKGLTEVGVCPQDYSKRRGDLCYKS